MRPRFTRLVALLCCGWLAAPALAGQLTVRTIEEPVFRGQAALYSAGPEQAPVVVLVHGIGDNGARDWSSLIARLAGTHRVLTFDLPGFGRSSKGNQPYTPDNYVAFIRHVVERELHQRPFTLIGHSLGAILSMRYAARYPRDVSALVLADMPGILHRMAYSQYLSHLGINTLPNLYPAQNAHLHNLVTNILGFFEKAKPAPEMIVSSATLREKLLGADPAKIAGLALSLEDYGKDIELVQAPTLLLWGGRDEVAPLRNARILSANMASAQLEIFPDSGHTPMEDVPEAFNGRVMAFVHEPRITQRNDRLRAAAAAPVTDRVGRCRGQRRLVFEGDYDRIEIQSCRDVTIRNARVRSVQIVNAAVSIEDSVIGGTAAGGLAARDARIWITSSLIDADIAIEAEDVRFNIAGSRLRGRKHAITSLDQTDVVFSVSRAESPHFNGRLHGLQVVLPDRPL